MLDHLLLHGGMRMHFPITPLDSKQSLFAATRFQAPSAPTMLDNAMPHDVVASSVCSRRLPVNGSVARTALKIFSASRFQATTTAVNVDCQRVTLTLADATQGICGPLELGHSPAASTVRDSERHMSSRSTAPGMWR